MRPSELASNPGLLWRADTYLAWRHIFKSYAAEHQHPESFRPFFDANPDLCEGRDEIKLSRSLTMLLRDGIFEKESLARAMFPFLFDSISTDARDGAESRNGPQLEAAAGRPPTAKPSLGSDHFARSRPEIGARSSRSRPRLASQVTPAAMAPNLVEARRADLYLKFHHVFVNHPCRIWDRTDITRVMQENNDILLPPMVINPSRALQELLWKGVFHSEARARSEFPWHPDIPASAGTHSSSATPSTTTDDPDEFSEEDLARTMPYRTQHTILTAAQESVEASCFDWATKAWPDTLKRKGWDCAAAGELTVWIAILSEDQRASELLTSLAGGWAKLSALFTSMQALRLTAVHRNRKTPKEVSQIVRDAAMFSRVLGDGQRAPQLERVARELDQTLREADERSLNLRAYSKILQERRARVNEQERRLRDELVKKDIIRKSQAGVIQGKIGDRYIAISNRLVQKHEDIDRLEEAVEKQMAEYDLQKRLALGRPLEETALRAFGKAMPAQFQRTSNQTAEFLEQVQDDDSPAESHAWVGKVEARG